MTESFEGEIKKEYFEWLYMYVGEGTVHENLSYRKLFTLLHDIDFDFYIANDVNRARDGEDLRYRFAIMKGYEENYEEILEILSGPCSVLEMLVALAIRCEETIMVDPAYGDRTGFWFWNMLVNLGIGGMYDECYDEKAAVEAIFNFMERRYAPNGKGGLFYIRDCEEDLTQVEIWIQLSWYLNGFA